MNTNRHEFTIEPQSFEPLFSDRRTLLRDFGMACYLTPTLSISGESQPPMT